MRILAVATILLALTAGCAGTPERVEGSVRYRDPTTAKGRSGAIVTVTTTRETKPAEISITPEELGILLDDLEGIGLFDLAGQPQAPLEIPPGSIAVETTARRFFVSIGDLTTEEDGRRFSRSAYRIVAATQGGPHYSLPR